MQHAYPLQVCQRSDGSCVGSFRDLPSIGTVAGDDYPAMRRAAAEQLAAAASRYVLRGQVPPAPSALDAHEVPVRLPAPALARHLLLTVARRSGWPAELVDWLQAFLPIDADVHAQLRHEAMVMTDALAALQADLDLATRARDGLLREIDSTLDAKEVLAQTSDELAHEAMHSTLMALDHVDAHVTRLESLLEQLPAAS